MRQQIDVFLSLDSDANMERLTIEKLIKNAISTINPTIAKLTEIKTYEEADIVGNSPTCETLKASIKELLKIIENIAKVPLWGETENLDIEEAKESQQWEEEGGYYSPSCDTESSQLQHIVELARFTYINFQNKGNN